MPQQKISCRSDSAGLDRSSSAYWRTLCQQYLPITGSQESSIWRYSRRALPADQDQGWKLHVSATVLTAVAVLQAVAPVLSRKGVLYKGPASLDEVAKLNAGIYYGYSQIGKILTLYPRTDAEALLLARELHLLTRGMAAPSVPFDVSFRKHSCVYYRYGAFREIELNNDEHRHVIRDAAGNLVADLRESEVPPVWVANPFSRNGSCTSRPIVKSTVTPLQTTFKAFRALGQRGKGGVYQALDLSATPPRLCVLKEGRKNGEIGWDGRDGLWRVRHERRVLMSLQRAGVNVPRVHASFRAENNFYLAIEFIDGENFEKYLHGRRRRLGVATAVRRGIEIALLMAQIHRTGWVWRDCKPRNIVLSKNGELRPIDFEGACQIDDPDPLPWGTPSYVPPEWDAEFHGQSRVAEDLYALGVTIFILLVGHPPDSAPHLGQRLRRSVPQRVSAVLAELLNTDPQLRPAAQAVAERLKAELNSTLSARSPRRFSTRSAGVD